MKTKRIPMLCLALFLCALGSGCPAGIHGVNSTGYAVTPPTDLGKVCEPMGVAGTPTKSPGFTKLDPGGECNAAYRCDADTCSLEMTSPAPEPMTNLAFVADVKGSMPAGTSPTAVLPAQHTAKIELVASTYFGTANQPATVMEKFVVGVERVFAIRNVGDGKSHSKQVTATLTLHRGMVLGRAGFRIAYCKT